MLYGPDNKLIPEKKSRLDFWYNPYTEYGGLDDNIENTRHYANPRLAEWELNSLYESGGVWRRGVESPVTTRLARGIDFVINDDDSESKRRETEQAEKDLMTLWGDFILGNVLAGVHGGALLYLDYGDDQPLPKAFSGSLSSAGRIAESINFELRDNQRGMPNKIWIADRWQAVPQSYYLPNIHGSDHPKLGEVETYAINLHTTGYARLVIAHESRCIKIDGLPLSPRQRAANLMWGLSVYDNVYQSLRMLGISLKAMTDILENWRHMSVGIPDLANKIVSMEPDDLQLMLKQVGVAAKSTHNQNVALHDMEGGLVSSTTTGTGIPEIVGALVNFFCGEMGIPYSELFSAEGGALAGTAAETDKKNYHESLRFKQKYKDEPHIKRILWLLGYEPDNLPFIWPNMQEASRLEEISERDKQSEVDRKYVEMGAVLPEEIRVSRFSNPEPNLDQVIIDHDLDEMIERDEDDMEEEAEEKNDTPEDEEKEKDERTDTADKPVEIRAFIKKRIVEPENVKIEDE